MRSIGILGGIGPQATMDFVARLHRAAQREVRQSFNTGYPPLITVYLRHPPVLVREDGTPRQPLTLDPRVLEATERLGRQVELIAIPSNTPHLFLDEIRAATGATVLSMVDATLAALPPATGKPIGLIGLGIPAIYADRLDDEGRPFLTADEDARAALDSAILRVMEGAETPEDRRAAREALQQVRRAGARRTILGCTEIPLLLREQAEADDLINPAELLAQVALRASLDRGSPR